MEWIHGSVERVTFQSAEGGFVVAKLLVQGESVCIVGKMPSVQPGEHVRCKGVWRVHLRHGRQFVVEDCHIQAPADSVAIRMYLGSGMIRGVGPVMAGRIVEQFGIDSLRVIDEEPDKLLKISGVGPHRLANIQKQWKKHQEVREVMIFLSQHGVSTLLAQKIVRAYGSRSKEILKERPYDLARDLRGIGFKTADHLAESMGIARDAPQRIQAGILHVMWELSNEGHTCFPEDLLIQKVEEMLDVKEIGGELTVLQQEGSIIPFNRGEIDRERVKCVALAPFVRYEEGIALHIHRLMSTSSSYNPEIQLALFESEHNIELGEEQKQALKSACSEKVHIITGGPGTGKSTMIRAILAHFNNAPRRVLFAAPTGKAAKRMTEVTGHYAQTMHALLEFDGASRAFRRNEKEPLDAELIVIDEASMIDTRLMYQFLCAVPSHARLILVGDVDQLPSVGAGNILQDLIHELPASHLRQIFRQARASNIVVNAHRVNEGQFPFLKNRKTSDFFFLEEEEPQKAAQMIVDLVVQRLPKGKGLDPFRDIQVLSPMKRGLLGVDALNQQLQQSLNPSNNPMTYMGRSFHVGDRVMQTKNNYDKGVYNGEMGVIQGLDQEEQELILNIEGKSVVYAYSETDQLTLAYAVSIHKFQGSECPCIVMPVHTTHFMMLTRNLLYTGITRARKLLVIVGTPKAVGIAVRTHRIKERYTGLTYQFQKLRSSLSGAPCEE